MAGRAPQPLAQNGEGRWQRGGSIVARPLQGPALPGLGRGLERYRGTPPPTKPSASPSPPHIHPQSQVSPPPRLPDPVRADPAAGTPSPFPPPPNLGNKMARANMAVVGVTDAPIALHYNVALFFFSPLFSPLSCLRLFVVPVSHPHSPHLAVIARPSVSAAWTFSLGPFPKRSHRGHQSLQR